MVVGIGGGLCLQQPNIAAQTVLSQQDITIGITFLAFVQFLSGTVFITVCQTLLENKLVAGLMDKISGFDPSAIAGGGATSIRSIVPPAQVPLVLDIYNNSLRSIWYLALGLASLIFLASLGFEWKSVKKAKDGGSDEQKVESGSRES